jgi:hypothetical protein
LTAYPHPTPSNHSDILNQQECIFSKKKRKYHPHVFVHLGKKRRPGKTSSPVQEVRSFVWGGAVVAASTQPFARGVIACLLNYDHMTVGRLSGTTRLGIAYTFS